MTANKSEINNTIFPSNWEELVRAGPEIFRLYLRYLFDGQVKYGPRTVVFMQVGMFHEMYGVENELMNIGLVSQMAHDLNIQMTRRKKSIIENSPKNYLMAGFPSVHLDRYINILIEDGWTVIIVDQVEDPKLYTMGATAINEDSDAEDGDNDGSSGDNNGDSSDNDGDSGNGDQETDDDATEMNKTNKTNKPKTANKTNKTNKSNKTKPISKNASKLKKKVFRAITRVASPSTFIEKAMKSDNNFLVSLFLREDRYAFNRKIGNKLNVVGVNGVKLLSVGCAAIDLTTGENYAYEVYSNVVDQGLAIDEAFRFLSTFHPREIIINSDDLEKFNEESLITKLELYAVPHQIKLNTVPTEFKKLSYQNNLIKKCFPDHGLLSPIEYLDLESKGIATLAYVLMLQYAYEHNERLIQNLPKPEILETYHDKMKTKSLILANNTINQLNLIPEISGLANSNNNNNPKNFRSVLSIIDKTSTAMGSRLLRHKFLNPITDSRVLEEHYQQIEELRQEQKELKQPFWKLIERHLNIKDVERKNRKIVTKSIQPLEWIELDQDLTRTTNLINAIREASVLEKFLAQKENVILMKDMSTLQNYYKNIVDLELASKYRLDSVTDNFFKPHYDKELDRLGYKIKHYEQFFKTLTRSLSNMITPGSDYVSLKRGDDIYCLMTTKTRFNQLRTKFVAPLNFTIDDKTYTITLADLHETPVSKKSTNLNIRNETLTQMSLELIELHEELRKQVVQKYFEFLGDFTKKFGTVLERVSKFIAKIDVLKSIAKVADEYNYCKPTIVSSNEKSFILANNMRHPIIERINQSVKYVPHSFCLGDVPDEILAGNEGLKKQDGMIVFGVNACGKSSLMKSAGVNLILAQAGFYVAASSFIFYPYDQILTRIISNDNIHKGQSTFEVEMIELRGILNRARNNHSLILADEVCHGTETTSGLAIVAASVIMLANNQASFIFASHLHQLSTMPRLTALKNVRCYHLQVHHDETLDRLVYDRHLCDGAGDSIYGLEVVRSMHMNPEFIKLANEIRKEIMGIPENIIATKQSKYNADLYMTECQVCKGPAQDTHHIGMQCTADDKGFIDHYHKNILANLVVLCKKCHLAAHENVSHSGKGDGTKDNKEDNKILKINGYLETSEGPILDFCWVAKPEKKPQVSHVSHESHESHEGHEGREDYEGQEGHESHKSHDSALGVATPMVDLTKAPCKNSENQNQKSPKSVIKVPLILKKKV